MVTAFRKRKVADPPDSNLLYVDKELDISTAGRLLHTDQLGFLDQAAIVSNGDMTDSGHRVEELSRDRGRDTGGSHKLHLRDHASQIDGPAHHKQIRNPRDNAVDLHGRVHSHSPQVLRPSFCPSGTPVHYYYWLAGSYMGLF